MKAERNIAANTLRGTLLLTMAISRTLAKHRDRHPVEGSLPSSLAKGTSIVKKRKERVFKPPREAARSLQVSDFALRFGSGSPLPLN